jgi:hypothetical protein
VVLASYVCQQPADLEAALTMVALWPGTTHSVSLYVCVCVDGWSCLSVCVCVWILMPVCVCMLICLSVCVCVCVWMLMPVSLSLSLCKWTIMPVCVCVCMLMPVWVGGWVGGPEAEAGEALDHLLFLTDGRRLYDAALSIYDAKLAHTIARRTQRVCLSLSVCLCLCLCACACDYVHVHVCGKERGVPYSYHEWTRSVSSPHVCVCVCVCACSCACIYDHLSLPLYVYTNRMRASHRIRASTRPS